MLNFVPVGWRQLQSNDKEPSLRPLAELVCIPIGWLLNAVMPVKPGRLWVLGDMFPKFLQVCKVIQIVVRLQKPNGKWLLHRFHICVHYKFTWGGPGIAGPFSPCKAPNKHRRSCCSFPGRVEAMVLAAFAFHCPALRLESCSNQAREIWSCWLRDPGPVCRKGFPCWAEAEFAGRGKSGAHYQQMSGWIFYGPYCIGRCCCCRWSEACSCFGMLGSRWRGSPSCCQLFAGDDDRLGNWKNDLASRQHGHFRRL